MQTEKKRKEKKSLKTNKEKESPDPSSKKALDHVAFYKEVIDYLNAVCGTHYKHTTPKTQTLIKARIKEGFTLNDFKAVIQKKYNEWHDTDLNQYLRPETLFGTKFESYLNAPESRPPTNPSDNNNLGGKTPHNSTNKGQPNKINFNALEYPIGIDNLTFESPVMFNVYKKGLNEPQRIKLIGRLKKQFKYCDCGQTFLTETNRKSCMRCKNRSKESPEALSIHQKKMKEMDKMSEETAQIMSKKLSPEEVKKNKQKMEELMKGFGG
jgi:uncharacterized phage protein (TIGR02220 family)